MNSTWSFEFSTRVVWGQCPLEFNDANEFNKRTRINITLETQYPQMSVQNKVHELEM
jgi:hypothetical protein